MAGRGSALILGVIVGRSPSFAGQGTTAARRRRRTSNPSSRSARARATEPHRVGGLRAARVGEALREASTGCKVNVKYAGSSSEMVSLMANGGGHQYDLVSASGDADLRLIYGGDVKPINIKLIPSWSEFQPFLKSPSFNTINGVHYGVSFEFGPNVLLYSTKTSPQDGAHVVVRDLQQEVQGQDHRPGQPDPDRRRGALPRDRAQPAHHRPLRVDPAQFTAAVNLLKAEHPLIKKYWDLASQEISLFQNGEVVVGAAWPYQTNTAGGRREGGDTIPKPGSHRLGRHLAARRATRPTPTAPTSGWPTCRRPRSRPRTPISYGETPANTLACPIMNTLQKGSCAAYHANEPESYFKPPSSSGRRRWRPATTGRTTASASPSGNRPGRR
jgi:putative spermidine/putrescine transport system substrate-binding protein